jgi:hypothetical protein
MGWTCSSYKRNEMQPLTCSTSLVSRQLVTQHSTHTEGTTKYELRIHWMWHSKLISVSRSTGQVVPPKLKVPLRSKANPNSGAMDLTHSQTNLSHSTLQYLLYITLTFPVHNYISWLTFSFPRSQLYLLINLFLHNFGRKLCMNSHISHMRYTLHPTYPFFITLTPTKH